MSSDTVLTDVADETEEDISGASAAGDESVDYRMLMRDTKIQGSMMRMSLYIQKQFVLQLER